MRLRNAIAIACTFRHRVEEFGLKNAPAIPDIYGFWTKQLSKQKFGKDF
jgi:hypothetical protein